MISFQPYISDDDFRSSNGVEIGYIFNSYVFDIRYPKNFENAQPIKVEIKVDGILANDINGYALVLTNNLLSMSSDAQRHFD